MTPNSIRNDSYTIVDHKFLNKKKLDIFHGDIVKLLSITARKFNSVGIIVLIEMQYKQKLDCIYFPFSYTQNESSSNSEPVKEMD